MNLVTWMKKSNKKSCHKFKIHGSWTIVAPNDKRDRFQGFASPPFDGFALFITFLFN